ncbi:MAG: hypothetical protein ABIO70_35990 [Pseudomonadota bacterium]
MRGQVVGATPTEVVVWSAPFTRPSARLTLPGYRPTRITLHKDRHPLRRVLDLITLHPRKAFALVPNAHHEVLLIPEHEPAGTWGPEDVPE